MKINKNGETPTINEQQRRQRKFFLLLPLLILPFLTMAFCALGGGKARQRADDRAVNSGLDATLPQARFKAQPVQSKMAVYQENNGASSAAPGISRAFLDGLQSAGNDTAGARQAEPVGLASAAEQSKKIEAKLAEINHHLQEPAERAQPDAGEDPLAVRKVKKLHQMALLASRTAPDPEMQQLSQMLKQIQAIQNPESVREPRASSKPERAFQAIPAVIDGDQKIRDGAAIKLKLRNAANIRQISLPGGQELFGVSQVVNQRLLVRIKNIRTGDSIIPVDLILFSLDGMEGIPAPEAELGEAAGSGAANALQQMQFLSMDQSIGSQAAASGINAAKGLFNKRIKKIRVKVKDRYPVLLKINH